jgi:hypothetical protein
LLISPEIKAFLGIQGFAIAVSFSDVDFPLEAQPVRPEPLWGSVEPPLRGKRSAYRADKPAFEPVGVGDCCKRARG